MRIICFLLLSIAGLTSCSNKAGSSKAFCDTTCRSDSFKFGSDAVNQALVTISINKCAPDTLSWTHDAIGVSRHIDLADFINQDIRLHKSMIDCTVQDTVQAWLTFNDCITGRGYLLKLPFNKANDISKITGALNDFDPKFSVEKDLRAYTDRGSVFVVDINTGKEAQLSFKESFDIDFNKIHEYVDSVNITRKKIYVVMLKDGDKVPFEKNIDL